MLLDTEFWATLHFVIQCIALWNISNDTSAPFKD